MKKREDVFKSGETVWLYDLSKWKVIRHLEDDPKYILIKSVETKELVLVDYTITSVFPNTKNNLRMVKDLLRLKEDYLVNEDIYREFKNGYLPILEESRLRRIGGTGNE